MLAKELPNLSPVYPLLVPDPRGNGSPALQAAARADGPALYQRDCRSVALEALAHPRSSYWQQRWTGPSIRPSSGHANCHATQRLVRLWQQPDNQTRDRI